MKEYSDMQIEITSEVIGPGAMVYKRGHVVTIVFDTIPATSDIIGWSTEICVLPKEMCPRCSMYIIGKDGQIFYLHKEGSLKSIPSIAKGENIFITETYVI